MRNFLKRLNFWKISTFVLGVILVISWLSDSHFLSISTRQSGLQGSQVRDESRAATIKSSEIYKNLACGCCGKSIADCNCGMAKERRVFVDEQAAKGFDERGVYKEAIKKYGEEILFDKVLAAEIRKEVIAEAPKDRPIIHIEPESIDLGETSMAKGNTEAVFKVKNSGQTDLVISGMETSCGCTTVVLKIGNKESPVFGMSNNPTDWSGTLGSRQEAELLVVFDPAHHGPEGVGTVTRTVSISSNDPIDSFKKVQIEAEVIQ